MNRPFDQIAVATEGEVSRESVACLPAKAGRESVVRCLGQCTF